MSRTSCVRHPAEARYLKIYQWQLEFCDGNACAAALLSYFEFCHNWKLQHLPQARMLNNQLEKTPQGRTQAETLLQWHTTSELEEGVLIYKRDKISEAIKLLKTKGVIELHNNPDPRLWFDRTQHFLFLPETVNAWIDQRFLPDRICIVDKSEMPGETLDLPSINGKSEKHLRKVGDVPKNTKDKEKTTKTRASSALEQPLNGAVADHDSSSSSSLLLELPGLTEGAKTVPASPPVAQPDPVPSKAREPVVTPKKEERAFTPASKGQIRTNGESTSSDDPVALLRLVRANADAEPRGLAELVSEVFALSESQCAEIEHEIIVRGSGIAIQAAEWTLQEYRESAGASYWSAFKGGFIPRKAIGQKKTELRKAKEQSRQAEPDPRETLSAEQLSANTAPLRALREARA